MGRDAREGRGGYYPKQVTLPFFWSTESPGQLGRGFFVDFGHSPKKNQDRLCPSIPTELRYPIELRLEKFACEAGQFSQSNGGHYSWRSPECDEEQSLVKVPFTQVCYLEAVGKYSHLSTEQGDFLIQWPLKKLLPHRFLRIHRNYIVNQEAIERVELMDQQVVLEGDKALPFSQSF